MSENAHELAAGVSHSDGGHDAMYEPALCMSGFYTAFESVECFASFKSCS